MPQHALIVGSGHNGLVAAAILARAQWRVTVLEALPEIGGACRTETPFPHAPDLRCSTGAYLLGPMPPEVIARTGLRLTTTPRRPNGFFLSDSGAPCAFGIPGGLAALSAHDRAALDLLDATLDCIRDDLAPLWLREGVTTAQSVAAVRTALPPDTPATAVTPRAAYQALLSGGVLSFLRLFDLRDEMLRATVATDGFVGSLRPAHDPGTGPNFLAHNLLRLPIYRDGLPGDSIVRSWQLAAGGMGAITQGLAEIIRAHHGSIRTRAAVARIDLHQGRAVGVTLCSGESLTADSVVLAIDPLRALAPAMLADPAFTALRARARDITALPGGSFKVNMALRRLPAVRGAAELCGDPHAPLRGTVHVLPRPHTFAALERGRAAVAQGRLPDPADTMIDVYTHTAADDSLRDPAGRHTMSLFVQSVPSGLTDDQARAFALDLIRGPVGGPHSLLPELPELIEDFMVLTPGPGGGIERRFGITGGHIHHADNGFAFEHRLPARTPIPNLVLCGAGCHPAGSVIGASGLIAADVLLASA